MRKSIVWGCAVVVCVPVSVWSAQPARQMPARAAFFPQSPSQAAEGALTFPYGAGFEASEGFNTGALNGQAGWQSFTSTLSQPVVSTAQPFSGAQHLRLSRVSGAGNNEFVGGFSPLLGGVADNTPSRTTFYFRANNVTPGPITGGAEYIMAAQEGQGVTDQLSWQINFTFDGRVLVTDNIDADPDLEVVDVGIPWTAGRWYKLDVDLDTTANSIRYYVDDALEHTTLGGVFAGNEVRQVILLSDNFFAANENGNYDALNIGVIPEPGSLAVASLALLALRRRA
jgi:hypothetical protein